MLNLKRPRFYVLFTWILNLTKTEFKSIETKWVYHVKGDLKNDNIFYDNTTWKNDNTSETLVQLAKLVKTPLDSSNHLINDFYLFFIWK